MFLTERITVKKFETCSAINVFAVVRSSGSDAKFGSLECYRDRAELLPADAFPGLGGKRKSAACAGRKTQKMAMAIHPLDETYSVTAEWYVPEHTDHTISGTLRYPPGRIVLELQDTFAPLEGAIFGNEDYRLPRICGRSHSGEQITLIDAMRFGMSLNFGRAGFMQPDRFLAKVAIIGIDTEDDPLLPELSCRVPGLTLWLSRPTVETTYDTTADGLSMTFRVAPLPAETIRIAALNANLVFDVVSTAKPQALSLKVETIGSWRLVPDAPQPLSWYLRHITSVTAFLSLCAGVAMPPDCITIPTGDRTERASVLVHRPGDKYCALAHDHDLFLARSAFASHFERCLARWFEIYPQIETANLLAMSVLASSQLWPHVELLSLMQALEGFHRAHHEGLYTTKEKYEVVTEALVKAIPADVEPDHRAALKSRIRYGNEISLAKRLTLLCDELIQPIRVMLFGDSPKLLRRWVDTRNYYTHWDEGLRDKILNGQNLVYANARLRSLLRVLYLDALGVPQEIILRSLTGANPEGQFLIQIRGVERRAVDRNDTTGAFMFIRRGSSEAAAPSKSDAAEDEAPQRQAEEE